ncbi:MAG TPA: ArgE/DapE family deacylase [Gemmatimonadaceae bacterium]|nr:ArgE/DapE family deacylase [Gemmatimonadaceae bacterium]
MRVAFADPVALLRELVHIDSRNPSLVAGAPGEQEAATFMADVLREWGLHAELRDAAPGRPNVIAIARGSGGGRSLMLNGHLDIVGIEGMVHAPFDALERSDRIYGRGACDMKGGVAAMCAAAARVGGATRGDVIVTAVVDEEWRSIGTSALLRSGVRADAAIVTEPTGLAIMPAHRGFAWLEVRVDGRAAHGSRWDIGVDAIRHAGLLLAELDRVDGELLPLRTHPLLGRPSLHASTIEGGLGLSTYPDRCVFRIERRTIPGESGDDARRDVEQACDRVRARHPGFHAQVELLFAQPPSDVSTDAPIVGHLTRILADRGLSTAPLGMSAWTDAALLNAAGIPAICFGPGDMGLAHAAEEYIPIEQTRQAASILEDLARSWCG